MRRGSIKLPAAYLDHAPSPTSSTYPTNAPHAQFQPKSPVLTGGVVDPAYQNAPSPGSVVADLGASLASPGQIFPGVVHERAQRSTLSQVDDLKEP